MADRRAFLYAVKGAVTNRQQTRPIGLRAKGRAVLRFAVDLTGIIAAVLTTICWLPQAIKIIRDRDTRALSLYATGAFTCGIALWLIYGLAIRDWPLIGSNAATLVLMSVILTMKLRYG